MLDLGCGEGDLLARLKERGAPLLCGVEVSTELIAATMQHGVEAIDYDLNVGLPEFDDNRFDYVVLSSTLQAVPNVERLLEDALRVGRRAIVGFTNFAHRTLREMFGLEGRAPKAPGPYSYEWYNTPNRRFPSIRDMLELCEKMGVTVEEARYYDDTEGRIIGDDEDAEPRRRNRAPRPEQEERLAVVVRREPRSGCSIWCTRSMTSLRIVRVGVVFEAEFHGVRDPAESRLDRLWQLVIGRVDAETRRPRRPGPRRPSASTARSSTSG